MTTTLNANARLEQALLETSDVYVEASVDRDSYLADLAENIRQHRCEPFPISATVTPPGFPDVEDGSVISGLCVARNAGYWLVYQPEQDRFYCFWGTKLEALSAPGIFGSPLYCWSA